MKFLCFLFLLQLSLVFAANEKELHTKQELINLLKSMQGKLEPSYMQACLEGVSDIEISNCGNMHSRVLSDYMLSMGKLNQLRETRLRLILKNP